MSWWGQYRPYVSVAKRRANAAREMQRLEKKGQKVTPVKPAGRAIASTFWGKAWCENLESYSDFSNRLPRGRTYIRNGSVVHLQIDPGRISAKVSGSSLYNVKIDITPMAAASWKGLKSRCAGGIGSLVELLQGKLSAGVMQVVTARDGGLFPKPAEIEMSCSCPDYAGMCKHVAAVMYGVGTRLDQQPDLLFKLRKVDHTELIAEAGDAMTLGAVSAAGKKNTIAESDLAEVFGIELDPGAAATVPPIPQPVAKKISRRAIKTAAKPTKNPQRGRSAALPSDKNVPEAPALAAKNLARGKRRAKR
jgi:uncharacterized Zn finger protein